MFKSGVNRYMTVGVTDQLPDELKIYCWETIGRKSLSGVEMDYLQIFEFDFDDKTNVVKIVHRQEQPEFEDIYHLSLSEKINTFNVNKIYVIDDETHQTMLLPDEY